MTECPRRYPLESMPVACQFYCPIRRGIQVKESWHSPTSAAAQGGPLAGRLARHSIADKANKGRIARVKPTRLRLDIPFHKQNRARLPECGLIAYALYLDANGQRKAARRGASEITQVRRLGIYQRGTRGAQVLDLLARREQDRQRIARGAILPIPLSDSEIADIAGVSRQCVGQYKKRLGYT